MYIDKYVPKEILVFEGLIKLIDNGVSLNSITVSDIAKSAGIGKGTVYEYFKSKDEVIAKAILYKMEKEVVTLLEKSESVTTFEEKCNLGFEETLNIINNEFAYLQVLTTNKEIHHIFEGIHHSKEEILKFKKYAIEVLDEVTDLGIEEGIINPRLEKEYVRSVFISVYSGLINAIRFRFGEYTKEDIKRQKNIAYNMLIKALS